MKSVECFLIGCLVLVWFLLTLPFRVLYILFLLVGSIGGYVAEDGEAVRDLILIKRFFSK